MLVKCVNKAVGVTIDRYYNAEVVTVDGDDYFQLINDEGHQAMYRPERFEVIQGDYSAFVASRKKSGEQLYNEITPFKCDLNHMIVGLVDEVGELASCIKKHTMYNQPLDHGNFKEEAGDVLFYLEGALQAVGLTMQECIDANIEKLGIRYSSGKFTNEEAKERADKN